MDKEDIEYIESGELGHSTGDGSDAENTLSERIVRKGSRWQVQSEKGRNMGTYDTRKEAEDRLRDIEMFKHMKESGNHSVNESLQDEIERSLPEEILKDAFRDMGEQLQERVFDRGIDLGKYVLKYVRENLDDLIQSELDNVYNTYGFTEEDIENEIARINSIHSAQDYIDYVGDGIDWVEDIVLKGLQDRFLDIVGYVEDKVYELISSRDGMDCHMDVTHSFSPGDFPSHYLTVTKEVGDDIEERTIRIGDRLRGHAGLPRLL